MGENDSKIQSLANAVTGLNLTAVFLAATLISRVTEVPEKLLPHFCLSNQTLRILQKWRAGNTSCSKDKNSSSWGKHGLVTYPRTMVTCVLFLAMNNVEFNRQSVVHSACKTYGPVDPGSCAPGPAVAWTLTPATNPS